MRINVRRNLEEQQNSVGKNERIQKAFEDKYTRSGTYVQLWFPLIEYVEYGDLYNFNFATRYSWFIFDLISNVNRSYENKKARLF